MKQTELPKPPAEATAHSERVRRHLLALIERDGPLRFDRYWNEVMYAPGLGYYAAGSTKLGAAGDFVTAPELGPVFAQCMAGQLAEALAACDGNTVLEVGAGTGAFAAAALTQLEALGRMPDHYLILETSGELAERQREQLAPWADRVQWLRLLPDQPWRGVIFGNEVVDALAARRLCRDEDGWHEQYVDQRDGRLCWSQQAADATVARRGAEVERHWFEPPVLPWCTELQDQLAPWLQGLSGSLQQGVLLLVDYGYAAREYCHPQRDRGTLICHYRHRAHDDPFSWPGLTDLSVSVDFSALADAASTAGLSPVGYTQQALFLAAAGLEPALAAAGELPEIERLRRLNEIRRLTLPGEMGERFKVFAAARGCTPQLSGFALDNRLDRL